MKEVGGKNQEPDPGKLRSKQWTVLTHQDLLSFEVQNKYLTLLKVSTITQRWHRENCES